MADKKIMTPEEKALLQARHRQEEAEARNRKKERDARTHRLPRYLSAHWIIQFAMTCLEIWISFRRNSWLIL